MGLEGMFRKIVKKETVSAAALAAAASLGAVGEANAQMIDHSQKYSPAEIEQIVQRAQKGENLSYQDTFALSQAGIQADTQRVVRYDPNSLHTQIEEVQRGERASIQIPVRDQSDRGHINVQVQHSTEQGQGAENRIGEIGPKRK